MDEPTRGPRACAGETKGALQQLPAQAGGRIWTLAPGPCQVSRIPEWRAGGSGVWFAAGNRVWREVLKDWTKVLRIPYGAEDCGKVLYKTKAAPTSALFVY